MTGMTTAVDSFELISIGVDIGSVTTHILFSALRLEREPYRMSSRFSVVSRRDIWMSPVLLTPYEDAGNLIAAGRLSEMVATAFAQSGITAADVDTGVVILTGAALERENADAIAAVLSARVGSLVCASAGHHMEALLAAYGSGSCALSRTAQADVLNIDVGGATTKLSLIRAGSVIATAAIDIGCQSLKMSSDGERIAVVRKAARMAGRSAGLELDPGQSLGSAQLAALAEWLARAIVGFAFDDLPAPDVTDLILLDNFSPTKAAEALAPGLVTISGGVSEYFYSRTSEDYGDLARGIAAALRDQLSRRAGIQIAEPKAGIRATVVGASQFTTQASGSTTAVTQEVRLPIRALPVLKLPALDDRATESQSQVSDLVASACRLRPEVIESDGPLALAIDWRSGTEHRRLRNAAGGLLSGLARAGASSRCGPLIVLMDEDLALSLGTVLGELGRAADGFVVLDGLNLGEFDFIDIGPPQLPSGSYPVIVRSMVFECME